MYCFAYYNYRQQSTFALLKCFEHHGSICVDSSWAWFEKGLKIECKSGRISFARERDMSSVNTNEELKRMNEELRERVQQLKSEIEEERNEIKRMKHEKVKISPAIKDYL